MLTEIQHLCPALVLVSIPYPNHIKAIHYYCCCLGSSSPHSLFDQVLFTFKLSASVPCAQKRLSWTTPHYKVHPPYLQYSLQLLIFSIVTY